MPEMFQTPKWILEGDEKDNFPIRLLNYNNVNISLLKKLFCDVIEKPSNRRISFDSQSAKAFEEWFANPGDSLPGYAYARLSNWFMTDFACDRDSERGYAAKALWGKMFSDNYPEQRLTSPDSGKNGYFIPGLFWLWWGKLEHFKYLYSFCRYIVHESIFDGPTAACFGGV